jgi:hypothetical protein
MTRPTCQDAHLLIELAPWHAGGELSAALSWLWSDQFAPDYSAFLQRFPPESEGERRAALICDYFDTVGALYKHGLINGELLFDWLEVAPVWDRIKGYVLGCRHGVRGANLWMNFEELATAHKRQTGTYST